MKAAKYEKELRKLQVRLCHLQRWVKEKGLRVVIVLEGRDAAGKGGTIRALTERVSPRVFRVVALPAPSDREKNQVLLSALPAAFSHPRRSRHLRSQLVQPRRRRARDGLLQRAAARPLSAPVSAGRTVPCRRGYDPDQDLARGEQRGTEAALSSAHRRPAPAVEAERNGPAGTAALVRSTPARET